MEEDVVPNGAWYGMYKLCEIVSPNIQNDPVTASRTLIRRPLKQY